MSVYELDYFISSVNGNIQKLKKCIDSGININSQKNRDNFTALMFAIRENKDNIAEFLIKSGIDINLKNDNGDTALMIAILSGNNKIINMLIDKGADINTQNIHGTTPIHIASNRGYLNIVRILFNAGAIIDMIDNRGITPIMSAVSMKHKEVIEFLVENGAKLYLKNIWSETVFTITSLTGENKIIKDFLIESFTRQCYECIIPSACEINIKNDPYIKSVICKTYSLIVLKMLYELNIFLDMDSMKYIVETILCEINN